MQRLELLKRKLRSADELHSIVQSMKVITAVGIRQFENAAESLDTYFETIEYSLQILLSQSLDNVFSLPAEEGQTGMVVFGSGQGLCGTFDEIISDHTAHYLTENEINHPQIFVFGDRLSGYLTRHHLNIGRLFELPGTVGGINNTVADLLPALEQWQNADGVRTIILFYNKLTKTNHLVPQTHQLLPLDPHWLKELTERSWPTNNIPQFGMEPKELFSMLIRQYLFVSLYRAVANSLAAEYSSRLNSMQSAEQKIQDWQQKLQNEYRQQRQNAITEELLDIMAGFEVVREKNRA